MSKCILILELCLIYAIFSPRYLYYRISYRNQKLVSLLLNFNLNSTRTILKLIHKRKTVMSWIIIIRRTCFFTFGKKIKWRITRISSDNILAINTFTEYVFICLLLRMFHILSLLYPMIPWLMVYTGQHMYCESLCGALKIGKSHNYKFSSCQYGMLESKSANWISQYTKE